MRDVDIITTPAQARLSTVTVMSLALYDIDRGDPRLDDVVDMISDWAEAQGLGRVVASSETHQVQTWVPALPDHEAEQS